MSDNELRIIEAELIGASAEEIKKFGGIATSLASGGVELASGIQAEKETKAKAAETAKAVDAAQKARATANLAALKAAGEANLSGPLHLEAARLDQEARVLEAKAGLGGGGLVGPTASTPSFFTKMAGPLPIWGWGLVGVGGVTVIAGLVRLLRGKKR